MTRKSSNGTHTTPAVPDMTQGKRPFKRPTTRNRPKAASDGFHYGCLTELNELDKGSVNKNGTVNQYDSYEFVFTSPGVKDVFPVRIKTARNLALPTADKPLNMLTRLYVCFELLSLDQLLTVTEEELDELAENLPVEEMVGQAFKYRLDPHGDFYNINIDTLTFAR
jgi:hypothetical protein